MKTITHKQVKVIHAEQHYLWMYSHTLERRSIGQEE